MLAAAARLAAARIWRKLDRGALTQSWDAGLGRDLFLIVSAAQGRAVEGANAYLDEVLDAEGFDSEPQGEVVASALAGVASDGRTLSSLLYRPVVGVKQHIGQGVGLDAAMDAGLRQLQLIVETQVTDAGRVADGVATVTNRKARGYVRVLTPPSCGRCAILAGRVYSSERPFQRHPRCDCQHLPVGDPRLGEGFATSARDYFDSLRREQQERIFTKAGAQAIRDGADPAQVVNARRGMYEAGGLQYTREGLSRRGVASKALRASGAASGRRTVPVRPMPETLYRLASDRAEVLSLLRRYGYIT
jgi:hypothetical protein